MEWNEHDLEALVQSYGTSIISRRWLATWIDVLMLLVMVGAVGALLPELSQGWELVVVLVVGLGYYLIVEGLTGSTVGKLVVRIRVVTRNGARPTMWQTVIRTVLRLFEVNPLILGGLPAGLAAGYSKKRQRFGDMLAGTYVVFTKDLVEGSARPDAEAPNTVEPVSPA